jgi:hypothetical protein
MQYCCTFRFQVVQAVQFGTLRLLAVQNECILYKAEQGGRILKVAKVFAIVDYFCAESF